MSAPEKRGHSESVGAGAIAVAALFIVAFISFKFFIQGHPHHWLALLDNVAGFLSVCLVFLWLIPRSIVKFSRHRAEVRRERKEREEGLNGPSDQR